MLRIDCKPLLLLFVTAMVTSFTSSAAQDAPNKKELEAQAKQLAHEAKAIEDKGQLKESEQKYNAAEAIISTREAEVGLYTVRKKEAEKVKSLVKEAQALYSAKPADAATKLEEAQVLEPANPVVHYNLALCYAKLNQRTKAVAQMDQCLEGLPAKSKERAQFTQIRTAMMTGETPPTLTPDAKQKVDSFNDAAAKLSQASAGMADEDDEAEAQAKVPTGIDAKTTPSVCAQLKEVESSLSKSPAALFNLAKCAEEDGRQEDASRYLAQYLAIAPNAVDDEDVQVRATNLSSLAALSDSRGAEVRAHFATATRFIDHRKYGLAVEEFQKAEQIMPEYPQTKWRLALLYEAFGNVPKAREYYTSYQAVETSPEGKKEASIHLDSLDKERADYDAAVQESRSIVSELMARAMSIEFGEDGEGQKAGNPKRSRNRMRFSTGGGSVTFAYAQQQLEAARQKLEGATGSIPLGPEANELLALVYMQGNNPRAATRCYDAVASQKLPISFYGLSFPAHDRKAVKETKIELLADNARLVYLSSYDEKKKENQPPAKPAGTDGLGNLIVSPTEPPAGGAEFSAMKTTDLKGIETKNNFVALHTESEEIFLVPLNLTSPTPYEGVPARKFANNYTRLFLRYMGYDTTKLGKESLTGGEKFAIGMSFAAAGMGGYSALASSGYMMSSATRMMIAMYSFNAGMSTLRRSRAEQRELAAGNDFKIIPSQSFDLAFKEKFE